jgi:hypothetical protein
LGKDCVDLPRFDAMYKPLSEKMRSKIRGRGFTLYGLLDDIPELAEERFFIWFKNIRDYDLYIIADIWNHYDVYNQLRKLVPPEKIVVIDPSDKTRLFPFNNNRSLLNAGKDKLLTRFDKRTKYYKRELDTEKNKSTGISPQFNFFIKNYLPVNILPIGFSIPEEKITVVSAHFKTKLFTENIVDEEVSRQIAGSHFIPLGQQSYSFNDEKSYYADIQKSRFGITMQRSGWDCLRHYEFAANGAVLCFKHLKNKPILSAPHGLNESNCISYENYDDLKNRIANTDKAAYDLLLQNSYTWIKKNTTEAIASSILQDHSLCLIKNFKNNILTSRELPASGLL